AEHRGQVAVVGGDEVVARPQGQRVAGPDRLMAGAGDGEVAVPRACEPPHQLVQVAGERHHAVCLREELLHDSSLSLRKARKRPASAPSTARWSTVSASQARPSRSAPTLSAAVWPGLTAAMPSSDEPGP